MGTINPDILDIRTRLFVNYDIPVDKVRNILADIESNPGKIPAYKKLLSERTAKLASENKEQLEITNAAVKRVKDWSASIDAAYVRELANMSKQRR